MTCPLSEIGLVRWDDVALTVLSALAANVPVLLYGGAGAAKTDGAQAIAASILGDKLRWAVYECPFVQMDDIVGYVKPKSLDKDVLEFTSHAASVWTVNAVCFDEINRAHHSTANKFLEVVRTRRVYNRATSIEHVFATANPPTQEYGAQPMNAPMVSRFAVVPVPSFSELTDDEARQVLSAKLHPQPWPWWPVAYKPDVEQALRVRAILAKHGIGLTGRSAQHMSRMLGASHGIPAKRTPRTLTKLVLSCVPEAYDVCRGHRDIATAESAIHEYFSNQDAIPSPVDWPVYLATLRARAHTCSSYDDAVRIRAQFSTLRRHAAEHPHDVQDTLSAIVPQLAPYLNTSPTLAEFVTCLMSDA